MPADSGGGPRVALVTGGTDGIGRAVALGLARFGYHLIVVGRDADKGRRAEALLNAAGAAGARFLQADLASMRQVEHVARRVADAAPALHALVLNAGVVLGRQQFSADGIERNFAINYLSRFALTRHLLPLLARGASARRAARVVLVSGAARNGRIHFDDVNLTGNFLTLRAVLQCCRANDVFALALSRRLAAEAAGVTVACLKVGVVRTAIRDGFPDWMKWLVPLLFDPLLGQPVAAIAGSILRLILDDSPDGAGAVLFSHVLRFRPLTAGVALADPAYAQRLWALSERLSGCQWPAQAMMSGVS